MQWDQQKQEKKKGERGRIKETKKQSMECVQLFFRVCWVVISNFHFHGVLRNVGRFRKGIQGEKTKKSEIDRENRKELENIAKGELSVLLSVLGVFLMFSTLFLV